MPRKAIIDAPGALHHIIICGIERKAVFKDSADRDNFIERLGRFITETDTGCYAWVLMSLKSFGISGFALKAMNAYSIHKPPALPVRIEKVLPSPGDH